MFITKLSRRTSRKHYMMQHLITEVRNFLRVNILITAVKSVSLLNRHKLVFYIVYALMTPESATESGSRRGD